jgi:hypothetical protein
MIKILCIFLIITIVLSQQPRRLPNNERDAELRKLPTWKFVSFFLKHRIQKLNPFIKYFNLEISKQHLHL